MNGISIQEVSKTSKVEIFGHVFNGLSEIKKAVESYCRIGWESWDTEPKSPVAGIYVVLI